MSEVKVAFDRLLDAINDELTDGFRRLEAKVEADRLERLKKDLETLNAQNANKA